MAVQVNLPDENDLRSFLVAFRMFIAPNADIRLNKVCNTCFLGLKSTNDLRYIVLSRRERYERERSENPVGSSSKSTRTGDKAALLWMNGGYFHSDLDKYEELMSS
jgi:hypothetical protein